MWRRVAKAEIVLVAFFVIILITYLRYGNRVTADGRFYYFPYARSIVVGHDLDLADEYQHMGLNHPFYAGKTCTGRAPSESPVGSVILVLPIYLLTHVGVVIAGWLGAPVAADGYSAPYQLAYCLASVGYLLGGLFLLFRLLTGFGSKKRSLFLTLLAFLATPLIYYVYTEPASAVATSFFTGTLFLFLLQRYGPSLASGSRLHWLLLGIVAGVGVMVRWEQLFFPTAAAAVLAYLAFKCRLQIMKCTIAGFTFLAGFLIGFSPQLVIWTYIWGSPWQLPQSSSMRWAHPQVEQVFFSSRNGLFAFTPIALVGMIGLVSALRRRSWPALLGLLCIAAAVYGDSAHREWWGAYGFGQRRLITITAVLIAGCGELWDLAARFNSRHPRWFPAALLAAFAAFNGLLLVQVNQDKIDLYYNRSFKTLLQDQIEIMFDKVGYPFSWPANWVFASRYGVSPAKYDLMMGDHILGWDSWERAHTIVFGRNDEPHIGYGFSWAESEQGAVPDAVALPWRDAAPARATSPTWRWSDGPSSELLFGIQDPEDLTATLQILPFAPPGRPPQRMRVRINGHDAADITLDPALHEYRFSLPSVWLLDGMNVLVFDYAYTASPAAAGMSSDSRELAVQFHTCRLAYAR